MADGDPNPGFTPGNEGNPNPGEGAIINAALLGDLKDDPVFKPFDGKPVYEVFKSFKNAQSMIGGEKVPVPAGKLNTTENWNYVLDKLDVILLMSVNPGFGGQSFIPGTLDKLRQVRQLIDASGRDIRLEIDGGVKVDNIREIAAAGADMFVAGSAIFSQPDYQAVIAQMRAELAKVHG